MNAEVAAPHRRGRLAIEAEHARSYNARNGCWASSTAAATARLQRQGLTVRLGDRTNISSDSGKLIVRLTTIADRPSSAVCCIVNDE